MIDTSSRPKSRNLRSLLPVLVFLEPYTLRIVLAGLALIFTSGVMLSMGQGVRILIDEGFAQGSADLLNHTLLFFSVLVVLWPSALTFASTWFHG